MSTEKHVGKSTMNRNIFSAISSYLPGNVYASGPTWHAEHVESNIHTHIYIIYIYIYVHMIIYIYKYIGYDVVYVIHSVELGS